MCYETVVLFTWCFHTEHFLRRCPQAPCDGWKGHSESRPRACSRCRGGCDTIGLAATAWRARMELPMPASGTEGTSEAVPRPPPPRRISEHGVCLGIRKREDLGERRAQDEDEEPTTEASPSNMTRANGHPRDGRARRTGDAGHDCKEQAKLKPILVTAGGDKRGRDADKVDDGLFEQRGRRERKRVGFQAEPEVRYYVPSE